MQLQPLVDGLKYSAGTSVLHADETPVKKVLAEEKPTRPRLGPTAHTVCRPEGSYADFRTQPCGEHARTFTSDWRGKLVCDDYAGYKAGSSATALPKSAVLAHARRKFW
ncbi:transposase [Klebsiella pneumoniae]